MGGRVYILASRPRGTLYIGVTKDLLRRVFQHREGAITWLVHFEYHETMPLAIQREKNLKHWSRQWKIDLIVKNNPEWRDLWDDIVR